MPGGRPKKDIDPGQLEELAAIDCSYEEMAAVLNCSVSLLHKSYSTVIKKGRERGRHSLKRAQWTLAMGGNPTMLIWLGKQRLGQADQVVTTERRATEEDVTSIRDHLHRTRTGGDPPSVNGVGSNGHGPSRVS